MTAPTSVAILVPEAAPQRVRIAAYNLAETPSPRA